MLSASHMHSSMRSQLLPTLKLETPATKGLQSPVKSASYQRPARVPVRTVYATISAPGLSAPQAETSSTQYSNSIVEAPARDGTLKTTNSSTSFMQPDGGAPVRRFSRTTDSLSSSRSVVSQQSLTLLAGAHGMPHPEKVHKGGEDAYYIAESQLSIGVADGVGGWAEAGIDAGIYARKLMEEAKKAADAGADPKAILKHAHINTRVQGSSTACIMVLDKTTFHAANLGDSGFLIVRDGKLVFQTPQQQHSFNFPYQIGSEDGAGDQPDCAQVFEFTVQPGDIVVAGTDGLFDNVFPEEIAVVATQCKKHGGTSSETAQVLCMYARSRAADPQYASPFAHGAFQAGYPFLGGKMDDITVVVAYVVPSSRL